MAKFLDFEKQLAEIEGEIRERELLFKQSNNDTSVGDKILQLRVKRDKILTKIHSNLKPWHKVQIARHPDRPQFKDYLDSLFEDFVELAGDRVFGEESAIIGGLARFQNHPVVVMGQYKGKTLDDRVRHKFGMSNPEGYRKARRLINLASDYQLPILSFIDTPGAGAGIEAEERGQGEAIAKAIQACLQAQVPIIAVVIGEGFSGGAIAVGTADKFLMLENSIFTVISPEGCASILWKDAKYAEVAASALKLTAGDAKDLGIVDEVIAEPLGGAHRNPAITIENVKTSILKHLLQFDSAKLNDLVFKRRQKYLNFGTAN